MASSPPKPAHRISLDFARLLWSKSQRLGANINPLEAPGGWVRSLGGVDGYLALRARSTNTTRALVDGALEDGQMWVVPGVRGCIWLVPRDDVGLALKVGDSIYRTRTLREMARLKVEERELKDLGLAITEELSSGPMSPDDLRSALAHGTWRPLGEAGKKLGHSTTLPCALRLLEGDGIIRRVQQGGVLDTQRYLWALTQENPRSFGDIPDEARAQSKGLADRFFRWAGPATLDEFRAWSSLGKRVTEEAVRGLDLVPVEVVGQPGVWWVHPSNEASLAEDLEDDRFYLLTAQDNVLSLRGSPGLIVDPKHHDFEILGMNARRPSRLADARWINQRLIVRRGQWVGLWSWHLDDQQVIFQTFGPLSKGETKVLKAEVERLTEFISTELGGSCRANGIDSEQNQRARMAFIQEMADPNRKKKSATSKGHTRRW